MKQILVTGGTGFIGARLVEELARRGDSVTALTRNPESARRRLGGTARALAWDPVRAGEWLEAIDGSTAIVHLAGESVAKRWTPEARRAIEESRVTSTRLIVEAIGRAERKPSVLVSASAVGYYGPQPPERELTEESGPGEGFLASVCQRWEEAARGAEAYGVRVVMLRIGVVLGEGGGPLEKMRLPFKLFAGGPIGRGDQVISWVHRDDVIGLALLALDDDRARGPINVVAPHPVSSKELARALGQAMGRPSWLKTPSFALELAMGEAAEILTTGQRVVPKRALELGYTFRHPELGPALASILAHG